MVSLMFAWAAWYSTQTVVSIRPEGDASGVCFTSFKGDGFRIRLTHSVEKTVWEDYYVVKGNGELVLTHTVFESLGWGYPYSVEEGKLSRTADNKFILEINRPQTSILLRISEQAMQEIVHGGRRYDLVAMYGQGTAVEVCAQSRYRHWLADLF